MSIYDSSIEEEKTIYSYIRSLILRGKKSFKSLTQEEKRDLAFEEIRLENKDEYGDLTALLFFQVRQNLVDLWQLARNKTITHEHAFNRALDDLANRRSAEYDKYFRQEIQEMRLWAEYQSGKQHPSEYDLDIARRVRDVNADFRRSAI